MIPPSISLPAEEGLLRIADLAALGASAETDIRQTVMGCAAIIESYVDAVIAELVDRSGVATTSLGKAMIGELEQDFGRTWSRRNFWFGAATGHPFTGGAAGQRAATLVDLRNALAHGTGGLSRLQAREPDGGASLLARLGETLEVRGRAGSLDLGPDTARLATLIAREFVLALDSVFVSEGPPQGKATDAD